MIVIRKEQMDVFSQESSRQFEEEIIDFLQDQFPDAQEEPREILRPAVHEQVEKAKSYGCIDGRIRNDVFEIVAGEKKFPTQESLQKDVHPGLTVL